jgi:outer membrane phospholipase A
VLTHQRPKAPRHAGSDRRAVSLQAANLKGYLRVFSGYGSLIDYNVYQRVIGLGVQINFH